MLDSLLKEYKQKRLELTDAEGDFAEIKHSYETFKNLVTVKQKEIDEIVKSIDNEIRGGDTALTFDKQEIDGVTIRTRLQPRKVIVNDLDALPEQYKRVKYEVDKKTLKQALESGETVEGVGFSEEEYKVYVE